MKLVLAVAALALVFALPARGDQAPLVDYTLTVVNAPFIGDFSWKIQTVGFIQPEPPPQFDAEGNCTNCLDNFFTDFVSTSPPSNGGGCQITGLWLIPDYAPTTEFSPLCDGLYDAETGGYGIPDPGVTGSWTFEDTNADGTQGYTTLTVADPPGAPVETPEPATLALLACGLLGVGIRKVRAQ